VTNKIYVANRLLAVTVIDGNNNTTSTVAVGDGASSIAVNPVTNKVYVGDDVSDDLTVIDGSTNATTTVSVGSSPFALAINSVTNTIYVAMIDSNTVTVIDGASNTTSTVAAGSGPYVVAVNSVTNKIYVANIFDGTLTVIDGSTNTTSTVATFYSGFDAVAVNPVTNKVYVTSITSNKLIIVDGLSNGTAIEQTGAEPIDVAVNPITNKVYVANRKSNNVTVLAGAKMVTSAVLSSGLNPSIYGQKVTWTATVTSSGSITPTGKVQFTWSGYTIGSATLNSSGVATLTKSNLNADSYPLTAVYSGDMNNLRSTSAIVNQVVTETTSATKFTSTPNPSTLGQAVTFMATITSPTVIPTGPVTFMVGTKVLGTAQLSSGKAKFTTSTLPVGSTKVTAIYFGDSNIAKSSASVIQTVQ
jgi:YVTN family beta-propeller protein